MTSKTLSGTYSSGYTLAESYSSLLLTATAVIGGSGLSAPGPATVTNRGVIYADALGAGTGEGATGHAGVQFGAAGRLTNSGGINGGDGANGGAYLGGTGGIGYSGGSGGAGVEFLAAAVATNSGSIYGGQGGEGGSTYAYDTLGGAGGAGGAGVELAAGGSLTNAGLVEGGYGGEGGWTLAPAYLRLSGQGGVGGAGVAFGASGSLFNSGTVSGGYAGFGPGAHAGDGVAVAGPGVVVTVTNTGVILGGYGFSFATPGGDGIRMTLGKVANSGTIIGGYGATFFTDSGGGGGDGVQVAGGTVANTGRITGGDGGAGYDVPGVGGVGIVLKTAGLVTNTSGLIAGGTGGHSADYNYAGGRGGNGIDVQGGGTITNRATITGGRGGAGANAYIDFATYPAGAGGAGGDGVELRGGVIVNLAQISGGAGGAGGASYSGSQGSEPGGPAGKAGVGVYLMGGGTLTNGSATISSGVVVDGSVGVVGQYRSAATVINFATIEGATYSVYFRSPGDVLVAESGAVFDGKISGGGGTFELKGGAGTISKLGDGGVTTGDVSTTFANFGFYAIGTGGTWTLDSGTLDLAEAGPGSAQTLAVDGALNVTGALSVAAVAQVAVAGKLNLVANGAQLDLAGALNGAGTLSVGAGAVADFETGAAVSIGHVTLTSATSQAEVNDAALTYAGEWTQNAGTLSVASGDVLTFTGAGDTFKGVLAGAGALDLSGGSDTLTNLAIDTFVTVTGAGTVTATGTLTIGDELDLQGGTFVVGSGTSGAVFTGGTFALGDASKVIGASASSTLTNRNSVLTGAGQLGDGRMRLVNDVSGGIDADGSSTALVINTGTVVIINDGSIASYDAGGLIIESTVQNVGTLLAEGGNLTVQKGVTGAGSVEINSATADFASTFTQNVDFVSAFYLPPASGTLELAKSQTYTGTITGFTTTGTTALDLLDIAYKSGTTKATYSGTTTSGVLTVTDGTHTAHIKLAGDYVTSTWTLSSDGHGGTTIVDPPGAAAAPITPQPLIAAMAGFGAGAAGPSGDGEWRNDRPTLATLHAQTA